MSEVSGSKELDRLLFFSDAVFAIVMTLLILEIRVPDVPSDVAAQEVPRLVFELWPKFLSYVLSFLVIGLYWIGHHQTFRYVRSYDRTLLWLNLLILLSISFIPFPTDLLGEYGELRFAVIFYAGSLGLARLLLAVVWWYVVSGPIQTSDELDGRLATFHFLRNLAIPAIFFLSIAINNNELVRLTKKSTRDVRRITARNMERCGSGGICWSKAHRRVCWADDRTIGNQVSPR